MDDPVQMCFGKRIGRLRSYGDYFAERHRVTLNPACQRLAFDILHNDEGAAVLFCDFVNSTDIWMVERGGGASLSDKALLGSLVCHRFSSQEFDSDLAAEACVLCEVNLSHAARTELLDDAIVGDCLFDLNLPSRRWSVHYHREEGNSIKRYFKLIPP